MNRTLRTVAIDSLCLPGNWRQRLAAPHVRALADSGEILQPPAIRKADRSVIYGADRLAAQHVRGDVEALVWVVNCDDDEAARLRLIENLHRRHDDRDALADALVALELRRLEAATAASQGMTPPVISGQPDRKPGRPVTDKGKAREAAAKALGTTKEAIRSAEKRAAKDTDQVIDFHEAPPAVPGLDVATALDEIDRHLRAALTGITKLAKEHPELTERFPLGDVKWTLKEKVAPGIRACKPEGRCPYCKLVASELPNCAACKGSGWVTGDQMRDVPKELLLDGPGEGIFVGGKFVTLAELERQKYSPRAGSGGRAPRAASHHTQSPGPGRTEGSIPSTGAFPLDHTRPVLEAPTPSDDDWAGAWEMEGDE
ncbi:MAG: hypothetical protein LC640_08960 [Frankia sp.]|nr:hypothetical protein [Frankia sp.]